MGPRGPGLFRRTRWRRSAPGGAQTGAALFAHSGPRVLLTDEALRLVSVVWSMAEYPNAGAYVVHRVADDVRRRRLHVDGRAAKRPTDPIRLYRGATPDHRDGWSWTDDPRVAADYASGERFGRLPGRVWTAAVPPDRILCRNTERQENEYVVDTEALDITELDPA